MGVTKKFGMRFPAGSILTERTLITLLTLIWIATVVSPMVRR